MTEYNRLERGARRLVTEVWHLVDQGIISARSAAGDASLDLRDDIDPNWMPTRHVVGLDRNSAIGRFPSEQLEAEAIVTGYLSGTGAAPFDGWHYIDNAHNDLLREIIKQLVAKLVPPPLELPDGHKRVDELTIADHGRHATVYELREPCGAPGCQGFTARWHGTISFEPQGMMIRLDGSERIARFMKADDRVVFDS